MSTIETTQPALQGRLAPLIDVPPWKVAAAYLVFFTAAEAVTAFVNPLLGSLLHILILFALVLHAALIPRSDMGHLLVALLLIPLIRLISLTLPLFLFDLVYWYLIVSIPLFMAGSVVMRVLGISLKQVGFHLRMPLRQVGIILFGVLFGVIEFAILRPAEPLVPTLTLDTFLIATFSLFIGTGLMEELVFRGIIQQTSERIYGKWGSILFVSLLFAVMHIGWQSVLDVIFVFSAGLFWGIAFHKTRSIVGISLSHTIANVLLFVILPFIFPRPSLIEVPAEPVPITEQAGSAQPLDFSVEVEPQTPSAQPAEENTALSLLVTISVVIVGVTLLSLLYIGPLWRSRKRRRAERASPLTKGNPQFR